MINEVEMVGESRKAGAFSKFMIQKNNTSANANKRSMLHMKACRDPVNKSTDADGSLDSNDEESNAVRLNRTIWHNDVIGASRRR